MVTAIVWTWSQLDAFTKQVNFMAGSGKYYIEEIRSHASFFGLRLVMVAVLQKDEPGDCREKVEDDDESESWKHG